MSLASQREIMRKIRGDETTRHEFMAWLRKIRDRAGLTQGQMSEMLGFSSLAYGRWERGQCVPGWNLIVRLGNLHKALENAAKNGVAPLKVQGLVGVLAQPQVVGVPTVGECDARDRLQEDLGSSRPERSDRSAVQEP